MTPQQDPIITFQQIADNARVPVTIDKVSELKSKSSPNARHFTVWMRYVAQPGDKAQSIVSSGFLSLNPAGSSLSVFNLVIFGDGNVATLPFLEQRPDAKAAEGTDDDAADDTADTDTADDAASDTAAGDTTDDAADAAELPLNGAGLVEPDAVAPVEAAQTTGRRGRAKASSVL